MARSSPPLLLPAMAAAVVALVCLHFIEFATASTDTVGESGAGASAAQPIAALAARARHAAEQMLAPVAAALLPCLPTPVRELGPAFAHGAASLVMIGRRARAVPAAVNGAHGDAVLQHTACKFVYAAGAAGAELALLKLVYREPYRNQRRNPINSFFATATGFAILVLLTALPNDLVDTSLVCVLCFKLSSEVYTPAIVCGQLLRVYAAAVVPALPTVSTAYTALLAYWADGSATGLTRTQVREAWTELVLAALVVGAIAFTTSARRTASPAASQEPESDGDTYYDE
ncbi:hypothetical protein NESM_000517200 [Novymonas esmeraldas]|uniref:Uncharacterized protein n=1 Tax=Novymonas esmeraldas TaxID=1808958 RepID=A0AAW0ET45_9TRYP